MVRLVAMVADDSTDEAILLPRYDLPSAQTARLLCVCDVVELARP